MPNAADDSGYEIDKADVIYWGRCPECVAATSVSSSELMRARSVRHQLDDTALYHEQPLLKANSHQNAIPRQEENQRA